MAVVLACCSEPEPVCSIANSGAVGRTHSTGGREQFSVCSGRSAHRLPSGLDTGEKGMSSCPFSYERSIWAC
jgi:hypothetical protein